MSATLPDQPSRRDPQSKLSTRRLRSVLYGSLALAALLFGAFQTSNAVAKTAEETAVATTQTAGSAVQLPADYRATFTNYLSLDRVQNHDQIIRLFANDLAMQGPDEHGKLPFGSVVVGEVYKAKLDSNGEVMVSKLGRRLRDKLALIAVMERGEHLGQGHPEGLRNGNWEFAAFKPNGSVADKDLNACRACHSPLVETNHLFSLEHLE
ncbi:MAG: cytochrome P460 family protein [Acidobacteriota bacterium]